MTTISTPVEQTPTSTGLVGRPDVNRKRMARLGWAFSAPALIIVAAVTIFPILYSVAMSTMIALVLERLVAGRGWMMALLLLPWSMITVINAQLWSYIYQGTYGVAEAISTAIGLPVPTGGFLATQ